MAIYSDRTNAVLSEYAFTFRFCRVLVIDKFEFKALLIYDTRTSSLEELCIYGPIMNILIHYLSFIR